ncbi:MAG: hypothetical protein RR557_09215 [Bacilli bacterium]
MYKKFTVVLSILVLFSFNLLPSINTKVVSASSNITEETLIPNEEFNTDSELKLNEPIITNNIKAELVEVSDNYTKIKITNLEDNSVEFIEEFSKNGEEYIVAHSENESYRIDLEKEDNLVMKNDLSIKENTLPVITITNLKTNKKEQLEIKEETIKPDITTFSTADGFTYLTSTTGNAALERSIVSLVIGTIASIAGVSPAHSIAIGIGSFLFGINAPYVYYIKGKWAKSINYKTVRFRTYTSFFKYQDYTGGKIKEDVIKEWTYEEI